MPILLPVLLRINNCAAKLAHTQKHLLQSLLVPGLFDSVSLLKLRILGCSVSKDRLSEHIAPKPHFKIYKSNIFNFSSLPQ